MKSSSSAENSLLEPGALFGEYRILRCLGEGSLGACYLCEHTEHREKRFVVRVLSFKKLSSVDATTRFMHQVYISQHVNHKNIIRIFDSVETKNLIACTMEYLRGGTLADWIKQRPSIELRPSLRILLDICAGVRALHANGHAHFAISAKNILLTEDHEPRLCKFGVPRDSSRGQRMDLCAIGALGYELITGSAPFKGGTVYEMFEHLKRRMPQAPHQLSLACPRPLSAILMRALNSSEDGGYSSINELEEDLTSFFEITLPSEETFLKESRLLREIKVCTGEEVDIDRSEKEEPAKELPLTQQPTQIITGGINVTEPDAVVGATEILRRMTWESPYARRALSYGLTFTGAFILAVCIQTTILSSRRHSASAPIAGQANNSAVPANEAPATEDPTMALALQGSNVHQTEQPTEPVSHDAAVAAASAIIDTSTAAPSDSSTPLELPQQQEARLEAAPTTAATLLQPEEIAPPPVAPTVEEKVAIPPAIVEESPSAEIMERVAVAPAPAAEAVAAPASPAATPSLSSAPATEEPETLLATALAPPKPVAQIKRVVHEVKARAAIDPSSPEGAAGLELTSTAKLLFQFTDFVKWPDRSNDSAVTICVLNNPEMSQMLGQGNRRMTAQLHREFMIADLPSLESKLTDSCHVIFYGATAIQLSDIHRIQQLPILTVSEGTGLGIINLTTREGRSALAINGERAESSGLIISLGLLQLAAQPS